ADPETHWNGKIPVAAPPAEGEVFGVLYIPAMGKNYAYRVAGGTDRATVLDLSDKGVGHYDKTQMPGAIGNFAVAAHRSGPWVTPFREIMQLRVGDPIYLETKDGWYTYRFRSQEYVLPTETDVLDPFPRVSGQPGKDRIMTLTTCHPKEDGTAERAITYAVLDDFRPRSEGAPESLAEVNSNVAGSSAKKAGA
ncbi:MAG: class E sortase, partial [Actinobacteria bacterium]|nr:class E sortase [Actinomycetota bacterium]